MMPREKEEKSLAERNSRPHLNPRRSQRPHFFGSCKPFCTICAGNEDDFSWLHMQFLSAALTTLQHLADGGGGRAPWMALRQGRSVLGLHTPAALADSVTMANTTRTQKLAAAMCFNPAIVTLDLDSWTRSTGRYIATLSRRGEDDVGCYWRTASTPFYGVYTQMQIN